MRTEGDNEGESALDVVYVVFVIALVGSTLALVKGCSVLERRK